MLVWAGSAGLRQKRTRECADVVHVRAWASAHVGVEDDLDGCRSRHGALYRAWALRAREGAGRKKDRAEVPAAAKGIELKTALEAHATLELAPCVHGVVD